MDDIKKLEKEVFVGLAVVIGLLLWFALLIIILSILLSISGFGTEASAYNDGENNVECWDARVNDENILGTYHYERKCVLYTGDQTKPEEVQER